MGGVARLDLDELPRGGHRRVDPPQSHVQPADLAEDRRRFRFELAGLLQQVQALAELLPVLQRLGRDEQTEGLDLVALLVGPGLQRDERGRHVLGLLAGPPALGMGLGIRLRRVVGDRPGGRQDEPNPAQGRDAVRDRHGRPTPPRPTFAAIPPDPIVTSAPARRGGHSMLTGLPGGFQARHAFRPGMPTLLREIRWPRPVPAAMMSRGIGNGWTNCEEIVKLGEPGDDKFRHDGSIWVEWGGPEDDIRRFRDPRRSLENGDEQAWSGKYFRGDFDPPIAALNVRFRLISSAIAR